jgi:phage portal protein BeeE
MSLSPRDTDLEAKHASAHEIALAFGVPMKLLEIPGDNTYSNNQEANRMFWRQSVLPLAGRIGCALTHWLSPIFGEHLVLSADTDKIEALNADRATLWERVSKAPFLRVNEKRLAAGYGLIEGGDVTVQLGTNIGRRPFYCGSLVVQGAGEWNFRCYHEQDNRDACSRASRSIGRDGRAGTIEACR